MIIEVPDEWDASLGGSVELSEVKLEAAGNAVLIGVAGIAVVGTCITVGGKMILN